MWKDWKTSKHSHKLRFEKHFLCAVWTLDYFLGWKFEKSIFRCSRKSEHFREINFVTIVTSYTLKDAFLYYTLNDKFFLYITQLSFNIRKILKHSLFIKNLSRYGVFTPISALDSPPRGKRFSASLRKTFFLQHPSIMRLFVSEQYRRKILTVFTFSIVRDPLTHNLPRTR